MDIPVFELLKLGLALVAGFISVVSTFIWWILRLEYRRAFTRVRKLERFRDADAKENREFREWVMAIFVLKGLAPKPGPPTIKNYGFDVSDD